MLQWASDLPDIKPAVETEHISEFFDTLFGFAKGIEDLYAWSLEPTTDKEQLAQIGREHFADAWSVKIAGAMKLALIRFANEVRIGYEARCKEDPWICDGCGCPTIGGELVYNWGTLAWDVFCGNCSENKKEAT